MSSKYLGLFLLVTWFALVVGCGRRDAHEMSATAAAEASADGSVQVRKATAIEKASLAEDIAKRKTIDERFPASPTPWGAAGERVVAVSVPGVLELEGGRKIQLDGIRCNEQAVGYLRRVLQGDTTSVVVVTADASAGQPTPAEVWTADTDLQLKNLATGPSYSNIVEAAITSDWCKVETSATSKRNERYAALARAFQPTSSAR
jgi:hypothetical protein